MKVLLLLAAFTLATLSLSAQSRSGSAQSPLTPSQVNGTWTGGNNTIKVLSLGHGQLKIEFEGVSSFLENESGPYLETFVVTPENNSAALSTAAGVVLTLTFSDGTLNVEQDVEGLGRGIRGDGTYVRESKTKPRFSQAAQGNCVRMRVMVAPSRTSADEGDSVASIRREPILIKRKDMPLEVQQQMSLEIQQLLREAATVEVSDAPTIQAPTQPEEGTSDE